MDCAKGLTVVECSMCGDVGFPEKLQQCKACVRVQHMYVFSTSGGCHLCVISHLCASSTLALDSFMTATFGVEIASFVCVHHLFERPLEETLNAAHEFLRC